MRGKRHVTAALLALATAVLAPAGAARDGTILTAARIHTMDPARPVADALAFDAQGRIIGVGDREELLARYPRAARVDVGDATVVPGLIDAHGHVANLGLARMRVDLAGAASRAEVVERLRAFASELPADAWLLGRGWDQNRWPERAFPSSADLDAAFPERPVWLERVDGHAGWANSAALRKVARDLAGNWQPDGGRIERDADGRATGVFIDAAMALVEDAIPPLDAAAIGRALELGMRAAVAHGLTGVHDAGVSLPQLEAYRRLADRDALPLRITAMADGDGAALAWLCEHGPYRHPGDRLQMRAVKLYIDGALGSRGAALLEDYSDDPGNRGLLLMRPAQLLEVAGRARGCGIQVATHAIGDRGNRVVLDAYQALLAGQDADALRWRIEHAQLLEAGDLGRLASLGVVASMQPTHATSDMPWAQERVGPLRIVGAYAWRQLRDSGARLALGSDFPVESVDPRLGLHAAATRTDHEGHPAGGWLPQEKLTAWEALRGFTRDAAWAGFAEHEVGTLAPGMRADFVVLDRDPLAVPPADLPGVEVLATYVDGRTVFERLEAP
jgi:predicted amidohydrolase YtcJ